MRYDETPSLKSRGLFLVKKRKQIHRKKEKNLHILQGHEVCGQPLSVVCTTGEQGFLQLKQAFVSTLFFLPLSAKCSSVVEKPPWLESRNPSYSLFCSFPNRWGRKTSLKRNWVDLFLTSSQGHHSIFFFHFGPADSVKQKWMIAIPVLFSLVVGGKAFGIVHLHRNCLVHEGSNVGHYRSFISWLRARKFFNQVCGTRVQRVLSLMDLFFCLQIGFVVVPYHRSTFFWTGWVQRAVGRRRCPKADRRFQGRLFRGRALPLLSRKSRQTQGIPLKRSRRNSKSLNCAN